MRQKMQQNMHRKPDMSGKKKKEGGTSNDRNN